MSGQGPIAIEKCGLRHVRVTPDSDRTADIAGGPFRAKLGSRAALFDWVAGV